MQGTVFKRVKHACSTGSRWVRLPNPVPKTLPCACGGNLAKEKEARYDASWWAGGRKRSKTFSTKRAAERFLTGVVKETQEGTYQETENILMSEVFAKFEGSSHECMHGSGQWQVSHAVIEVADVIRCCPEAIGFMNDELRLVVQAFNGAVVDGHAEVVEDVLLVAAQHPGEVSQRWQA